METDMTLTEIEQKWVESLIHDTAYSAARFVARELREEWAKDIAGHEATCPAKEELHKIVNQSRGVKAVFTTIAAIVAVLASIAAIIAVWH